MGKQFSVEGNGDLITIKKFIEYCEEGYFIDYDGTGFFSDGKTYSHDNGIITTERFLGADPSDFEFEYVLWFNR